MQKYVLKDLVDRRLKVRLLERQRRESEFTYLPKRFYGKCTISGKHTAKRSKIRVRKHATS